MRPRLPEKDEGLPVDYCKVISAMGDVLSKIVTMKEPKLIYDQILDHIHGLFGLTKLALKMGVEGSQRISFKAVQGFDISLATRMLRHEYPEDWMEREIKEEYRVSRNGYLIDGEQYGRFIVEHLEYDPIEMYDHPESLLAPREFPEQWHEADFFEFIVYDGAGNVVGYLEVNDSSAHPDRLPSLELVKAVDVFSQLIGAVNRIWTQLEEENRKREVASLIASALNRDLMPLLVNANGTISRLRRLAPDQVQMRGRADEVIQLLNRSIGILDSITQMVELENRPPSPMTTNSLDRLVQQWKTKMSLERRGLRVNVETKGTELLTKADVRFQDLLTAMLSFLEIVSGAGIGKVNLELYKESEDDRWLSLRLQSEEIDTKGWKSVERVMRLSSRGAGDYHAGHVPLYVMNGIVRDYAGSLELDWDDDVGSLLLKLPHHWARSKPG